MYRLQKIGTVVAVLTALFVTSVAYAQPASRGFRVIRERIDESRLVTLYHNTRPEATAENDRGIVPDDFALDHLQLQLKRSPEREAEMKRYIDELHQSASPNYHKWLTAEEFGNRFGLAQEDITTVSAWLSSHGFTVKGVQPSGLTIDFSGTAGMVREAYHTEIHKLEGNAALHFANMSDPKIPAALDPAIAGVVSLHNFPPTKNSVIRTNVPVVSPGDTISPSRHAISAQDIATIYNLTPLFNAGLSGTGQTVMVLEDTDVYDTGDWTIFRKTFGLARAFPGGTFTQVHPAGSSACTAPGVNGDDSEAILDAEWASAAAPNAAIVLASCANTTADGILIALLNVLNGSATGLPSVISISYGGSEEFNGAAANLAYSNAYALAVLRGVSIFASSGDEGAASSDAGARLATHGITVSGLTSTPYNVSVGGTDFGYRADNVSPATYWNSTNNNVYSSALSYIQEIPWNNSCASALLANYYHTYINASDPSDPQAFCNTSPDGTQFLNTVAGSGGPSACATGSTSISGVASGTCVGYAKPSWQAVLGNPSDGARDTPDVSLFAANGFWDSYYIVCYSDTGTNRGGVPCTGDPSTWTGFGGTSVSSPIMAGIQALVNQRTGSRWGNPNVNYYRLAALEYPSAAGAAACNSTTVNKTSNTCIFYDVTQGDIDIPCRALSGTLYNCYLPSGTNGVLSTSNASESPAYGATPGWDFATGIGTVNAFNLVMAAWM